MSDLNKLDWELIEKEHPDLWEFSEAISGSGQHARNWADKPHRLIYDLIRLCLRERMNNLKFKNKMDSMVNLLSASKRVLKDHLRLLDNESETGLHLRLLREVIRKADGCRDE
jgi:hypothetical protein